jgi:Mrp family chromosome partitioning ATPase
MSALDRAFVKVYRQGGAALAAPAAHAPPAVEAAALTPLGDTFESSASQRDGGISVAELYASQVTFADIAHASVRRPHSNFSTAASQQVEITLPPLAQEPAAAGPIALEPSPLTASLASSSLAPAQAPEGLKPTDTEPAPARSRQPLRPVFEVPRFSWPSIVKTLSAVAEAQIAVLARALTAASRQGQKLVLVTGCARGEGRTTLSLALGKALASPARKILLVDADFEHSQLADALGVLPQVGWDDVLWGNQPLAEALIESLDDHLSLLPLRQPSAAPQRRTPAAQWKASLGELTQNYDIVLLDAGPLTDDRKSCDTAALAAQHPIDSALVVRDLRRAGADAAREVGRRLVACDITHWNIVENFCPEAA